MKDVILAKMCQKSVLLTCNGIRCWCVLLLPFLNEHNSNSRIPLRKLRLKKAYNNGLMAEFVYDTRNVNGVNRDIKFDEPL